MNITFISSYMPRKCGIASYTRDLAIQIEKQGNQITIVALENLAIPTVYSSPVLDVIRQENIQDYLNVAKKINISKADTIHLQHEFGLFGGKDGKHILTLAKALLKPLIVTFHTVLFTPTESQKYIIQELARLANKVIVMDGIAKDRLENIYGLNPADIGIILHGAPEVINISKDKSKKGINLSNTFLMLANNLLSRNKGIEYGIEAVAKAKKYIPNLRFLIVGETHPVVKAEEGESYQEELKLLVKKLGLEENVMFINKYVSIEALREYLSAADVYITPYLDPEQTISGTLSYAIGAGKACIASEYVYAKEMLAGSKGIIVPFRDSSAISDALIKLFQSPKELHRLEGSVGVFSKKMSWSSVSEKHMHVYKKIVLERNNISQRVQEFINSPLNLSHLIHLTNSFGIIQHASLTTPSLRFGYSTCDNARALIVVSQLFNIYHSDEMSKLITVYSNFLNLAQEPNGKFHTFLSSDLNWGDAEDPDAYGRALWGLGFHLYTNKNHPSSGKIFANFQKGLEQVENIIDLRSAAYTIHGLYYFILAYEDTAVAKQVTKKLEILAQLICRSFEKNSSDKWKWFESVATYDNFRLPQALFAAFIITKNPLYKKIAKVSLEFLEDCNFNSEGGYFDFIGQDGWHKKNSQKAFYDQQPLEAAGAVEAYLFASNALDDDSYLDKGLIAFEWFFGKNRNQRSIYDEKSKGVADGLTPRGVNLNQGAESIICFLISLLSLQQISLPKDKFPFYPKQKSLPQNLLGETVEDSNLIT